MTPAEAVRKIDAMFTVCREPAGYPTFYLDQNDKEMGDGPRDMEIAPCGEPYVMVSSFGVDADLKTDAFVMFASESLALRWFVDEIEDYAASIISDRAGWKSLHLYWRTEPKWFSTTYIVMDQAGLLQTKSPLSALMNVDLGFVQASLLITKTDPNGKGP